MALSLKTRSASFALALVGLAGCVAPPPPVIPAQIPYVAIPGPTKTPSQFQQDDTACRAAAVQLPPGPGVTRPPQGGLAAATAIAPYVADAIPPEPPGISYLRCMEVRNNLIQSMPQSQPQPALYASYPAYPVYVGGYGDYYPWLYGDGFYGLYGLYGFGFYGGFGYGRFGYGRFGYGHYGYGGYGGYGGFRGGYGGYGGYRGGYGGYGGGFRGGYGEGFGGGYRGGGYGGGYGGGGFGGGFHGGGFGGGGHR